MKNETFCRRTMCVLCLTKQHAIKKKKIFFKSFAFTKKTQINVKPYYSYLFECLKVSGRTRSRPFVLPLLHRGGSSRSGEREAEEGQSQPEWVGRTEEKIRCLCVSVSIRVDQKGNVVEFKTPIPLSAPPFGWRLVERRRRFNINDRIKELGTLIPKSNDP